MRVLVLFSGLLASAMAFSPSAFSPSAPQPLSPSAISSFRPASQPLRPSTLRLRMQEQEQKAEDTLDQIASKGIWQGGLTGEAQEALARVGWVDGEEKEAKQAPVAEDLSFTRADIEGLVDAAVAAETFVDDRAKEMYSDEIREKLVKQILRQEVRSELGIELEDLLNPIKIVGLEKKILKAERELESASGERAEELTKELSKYKVELSTERRQVMMDWLKVLFRGQALLSVFIGGALAWNAVPGWDVPIFGRAFGFWTMWLFTIPSLRAVKPLGYPEYNISPTMEKKALNLAFVLTPLTTIALPFATKDTGVIFTANLAAVALCYAIYILKGDDPNAVDDSVEVKGILKYLDYGSGRERGARK